MPIAPAVAVPAWWPVESKASARGKSVLVGSAWRGFQQLVSYWKRISGTAQGLSEVGFGIVSVFKYVRGQASTEELRAHVFVPQNQPQLQTLLTDPATEKTIVKAYRQELEGKHILHGV